MNMEVCTSSRLHCRFSLRFFVRCSSQPTGAQTPVSLWVVTACTRIGLPPPSKNCQKVGKTRGTTPYSPNTRKLPKGRLRCFLRGAAQQHVEDNNSELQPVQVHNMRGTQAQSMETSASTTVARQPNKGMGAVSARSRRPVRTKRTILMSAAEKNHFFAARSHQETQRGRRSP